MSFTENFEKTAAIPLKAQPAVDSLTEAFKYIGKSLYYGGRGASKAAAEHGKLFLKKLEQEPELLARDWHGWSSPKSYEAVFGSGTRFAPEIAAGGGALYLGSKYLSPHGYPDAPIAYY